MLDCEVHDATNTIGIQYPQSVFGVSGGRRSAAVSLHHLLPLQVTAESLINTPSQGESPITLLSLSFHILSPSLCHMYQTSMLSPCLHISLLHRLLTSDEPAFREK